MIEREFKEHPRGLKLSAFVWFFQTVLNFDMADQLELIEGLLKLFTDIDINGDGDLQWSEFNQYIVDEVLAQPPLKDVLYQGRLSLLLGLPDSAAQKTDVEIVRQAYAQSAKNYQINERFSINKVYFQKGVQKILHNNRGDVMYCLQQGTDTVEVIDNKCDVLGRITIKDSIENHLFRGKNIKNEVKSTLLTTLLTPRTVNQLDFKTQIVDMVYCRLYKNVPFSSNADSVSY